MRISELIIQLQEEQKTRGDLDLFVEEDDGRSTWRTKCVGVNIEHRKQWKGHPDPAAWYIKLVGAY